MSKSIISLQPNAWFTKKGPESDCVISSRIRISRNLTDHRFPNRMTESESEEISDEIQNAFSEIPDSSRYSVVSMGDLSPVERRILLERNIIPQEYTVERHKKLILHKEKYLSGIIHNADHLRISGFAPGLQIYGTWEEINKLDTDLEKLLDFSVSLDLGYLNADIVNMGTGMKVSTMLHLPALSKSGLIDKTCKAVVQIGLGVKGFFGDDENSLGDMYQISNQVAFGSSEKELLEKLENVTYQIVHYERRIREELIEKKKIETEDQVFRAFGILTNCRSISSKEAIEHLLNLRLGVVLGLIAIPIETITELLFISQRAHIEYMTDTRKGDAQSKQLDVNRAEMMREMLTKTTYSKPGEREHV